MCHFMDESVCENTEIENVAGICLMMMMKKMNIQSFHCMIYTVRPANHPIVSHPVKQGFLHASMLTFI